MLSDKDVFIKIKTRLEFDVGGLINLVREKDTKEEYVPPFLSFLRMLFPVAESIGKLLYDKNSSQNLYNILHNDLALYNENYAKVAGIIVILFRHSIIHIDVIPILTIGDTTIRWALAFGGGDNHLELLNLNTQHPLVVQFNVEQFYKDLIVLLEEKSRLNFNGDIEKRYKKWFGSSIDKTNDFRYINKKAIEEITALNNK